MCFDGDPADVWIERRRRARKQWKCVECRAPIPPGCAYIETSYLSDGSWGRDRSHVECDALWDFVWKELCDMNGLKMLGGLSDEIGEYQENEMPLVQDEGGEMVPPEVTLRDIFDAIRSGYAKQVAA